MILEWWIYFRDSYIDWFQQIIWEITKRSDAFIFRSIINFIGSEFYSFGFEEGKKRWLKYLGSLHLTKNDNYFRKKVLFSLMWSKKANNQWLKHNDISNTGEKSYVWELLTYIYI